MRSLAGQLLGDTRTAILVALLLRPDEPQHLRELARQTGVSPGTLHRELTALESLGVLSRNAVGRQVFFSANRACPVFEELAGLLRKTVGRGKASRVGRAAGVTAKRFESPRGGGDAAATAQSVAAGQTLPSPVASHAAATAAKGEKALPQKLRISLTKLEALCRKYGVARLSLFGSASRGELRPESNVDLMVEFSPDSRASLFDITSMQDEFSEAFGGRKVEIATREILRDPLRRDAIVPDLKLIYEA
jgi:predicted nucleotidyltransferase/DNA-binding transcriptional ArsR family regulator